jgi:plasmid stabilization system protein ParE
MPGLIWSPPALQVVQRLSNFLHTSSPEAAQRAVQAIRQGVKVLASQPGIGRPAYEMDIEYREWIIDFGSSGYLVLFRFQGDTAHLLAVRHQRELGNLFLMFFGQCQRDMVVLRYLIYSNFEFAVDCKNTKHKPYLQRLGAGFMGLDTQYPRPIKKFQGCVDDLIFYYICLGLTITPVLKCAFIAKKSVTMRMLIWPQFEPEPMVSVIAMRFPGRIWMFRPSKRRRCASTGF